MIGKLVLLLCVCLLSQCGVKKKEPDASPPPAIQTGDRDLPIGVLYSAHKKFLVKASVNQIQIGEEKEGYLFPIVYTILSTDLTPLNKENYFLEVKYGMPSMPQMKIKPAVLSYLEGGKVSVLYRIDMAQDWRMELKIFKKEGTLEDTLTYNYFIPE